MNGKGIFITFMVFLLVGTILAISFSMEQAEVAEGQNLVDRTAFNRANSAFNNIREQVLVAKEGDVSEVYGRFMPFDYFRADSHSFEIRQRIPIDDTYLKNSYDALNLFAVFAQFQGGNSDSLQVNVKSLVQNTDWGGIEEFPEMEYIVLPQCYKFLVGGVAMSENGGVVKFEPGTMADGCESNFDPGSIKASEGGIHLIGWDFANVTVQCSGDFKTGGSCSTDGNPGLPGYAKVEIELEGCPYPCGNPDFDDYGKKAITTNYSGPGNPPRPTESTFVQVKGSGGVKNAKITVGDDYFLQLGNNLQPSDTQRLVFIARVEFHEPIDEIALSSDLFSYNVKNPAFGICRGTEQRACSIPCIGGTCGNGAVEGTEECDDGNEINGDGCDCDCRESW